MHHSQGDIATPMDLLLRLTTDNETSSDMRLPSIKCEDTDMTNNGGRGEMLMPQYPSSNSKSQWSRQRPTPPPDYCPPTRTEKMEWNPSRSLPLPVSSGGETSSMYFPSKYTDRKHSVVQQPRPYSPQSQQYYSYEQESFMSQRRDSQYSVAQSQESYHHASYYNLSPPPSSDDDEYGSSSTTSTSRQPPHSNKKYTPTQVDFMVFQKEDMGRQWSQVLGAYLAQWPEEINIRRSAQCFSSRSYRDHWLPWIKVDDNGEWHLQYSADGKVLTRPAKVRDRKQVVGAPYHFIEKHPLRALTHAWVPTHMKEMAEAIIQRDERDEATGSLSEMGKWRKMIRMAEAAPHRLLVKPDANGELSNHHLMRQDEEEECDY